MLNRCVSLLLIVGIIANPLASMPHAHAGMSPQGRQQHDAIPHIHFHGAVHDHHEHHHDDEHSHHGHPHKHASDPVESSDDQPQHAGLSDAGHHPLAFHLPASAMAAPSGKPIGPPPSLLVKIAFIPNWQPIAEVECAGIRPAREQPSERIPDGSSLYLTLRNLRL
jgi:hypothetical protein